MTTRQLIDDIRAAKINNWPSERVFGVADRLEAALELAEKVSKLESADSDAIKPLIARIRSQPHHSELPSVFTNVIRRPGSVA